MPHVDGRIEGMSESRRCIYGWVAVESPDIPPKLTLSLGAWSTEEVEWSAARPEIKLRTGAECIAFSFHLPFKVPPGLLLNGDLCIDLFGDSQKRLVATRGLQRTERQYAIAFGESFRGGPEPVPTGLKSIPHNPARTRRSAISLPVGTQSADTSAAVGLGGQLYLRGGTNRVKERYKEPESPAEKSRHSNEVRSWLELAEARHSQAAHRGIRFLQMIQPEKSTVLESGLPELGCITPAFRDIDNVLHGESYYLSTVRDVEASRTDYGLGMPLDSHLSPVWVARLAKKIASFVDPEFSFPELDFSGRTLYECDLSRRFFGEVIPDVVPAPDPETLGPLAISGVCVSRTGPRVGHKTYGRSAQWTNPDAPIDKRVIVFGSSTSSDSNKRPYKLSYWGSRIFRDYKFVWSPEIDYRIVDKFSPDIVIGQVAERFLGRIPEDSLDS